MTTVIDIGSHTIKFGSTKIEKPWLIPQNIISFTKVNNYSQYSFNDFGISMNADHVPALQYGAIDDLEQVERLLYMVSIASSAHQDPDISQYIADLTKQVIASNRATNQIPEIENIPCSILEKCQEFDESGMQKIFMITPHSKEMKYKLCQELFEKYNINKIGFGEQSVMSLFSTGSTSGVSVSLGHGATTISVVIDGYWLSVPTHYQSRNISGNGCRKMLVKMLQQNQIFFGDDYESQFITNIMKNQMQQENKKEAKFTLPDGQEFNISNKTLNKLYDLYTDPQTLGMQEQSIYQIIDSLIQQIPEIHISNIKRLHFSGGMANIRQIPEFVARKWDMDKVMLSQSNTPELDAFVGAQAVVLTAPDTIFVDKESFQERGEQLFNTFKDEPKT